MMMHGEETDKLIVKICEQWDLDEELATAIIDSNMQDELDGTMLICEDGTVESFVDEQALKEGILEYMHNVGGLYDISCIYIDGIEQVVNVDIDFEHVRSSMALEPDQPPDDYAEDEDLVPPRVGAP